MTLSQKMHSWVGVGVILGAAWGISQCSHKKNKSEASHAPSVTKDDPNTMDPRAEADKDKMAAAEPEASPPSAGIPDGPALLEQAVETMAHDSQMNFPEEYRAFQDALARYQQTKYYTDPKTDEERLLALQVYQMSGLTRGFIEEQIRQNRFEVYSDRLKRLEELQDQTESIMTSEAIKIAEKEGRITKEEADQAQAQLIDPLSTPRPSPPADRKRTKLQLGTGILFLTVGALGTGAGAYQMRANEVSSDSNKLNVRAILAASIGISLSAIILGALVVSDKEHKRNTTPWLQMPLAAAAVLLVAGSVMFVTSEAEEIGKVIKKKTFTAFLESVKTNHRYILGVGVALGAAVGMAVWVDKLSRKDEGLALNEGPMEPEELVQRVARFYVAAQAEGRRSRQ